MIRGYCTSNVDDFQRYRDWPEVFVALPKKGDIIRSLSGLIAKVYSITHCQAIETDFPPVALNVGEPFIKIEIGRI